jgi:hypothetical protein
MTDAQGRHTDAAGGPRSGVRARFWIEVTLAVMAAVLTAITAIVPDWIERLTDARPDSGAGELEWMLALIPAVIAVGLGFAARREWRRALPA